MAIGEFLYLQIQFSVMRYIYAVFITELYEITWYISSSAANRKNFKSFFREIFTFLNELLRSNGVLRPH